MPGTVHNIPLEEWWDPADVFAALFPRDTHAFWLDAGVDATTGVSYLGAATERSVLLAASGDGAVTLTRPGDPTVPAQVTRQSVFDALRASVGADVPEPGAGDGFQLGWIGWLGYEVGARALHVAAPASRYPDAALLYVDRALRFDHAARTVSVLVLHRPGDPPTAQKWAADVEATMRDARTRSPADPARRAGAPPIAPVARWRHDPERYAELIARCTDAIRRGDAYQVCLTNEVTLDVHPDPVEAYLALRAGSPTHHGGLLRFGDTALLSASPEQFLAVDSSGHLKTKPIKGTRPRSPDPATDALLRDGLISSDKERAENLMIVDLMRNDVGRVAALGSVAVTTLLEVESYAQVHQLVSTVEADLAAGLTAIDAVEACFPAGSMTGAPKLSAMRLLADLEAGPRGIYAGAFGYFGLDGAVDLAMVIRSIVLSPEGASVGTGGGITALSDPLEEIEETRVKAAALLGVLGVR